MKEKTMTMNDMVMDKDEIMKNFKSFKSESGANLIMSIIKNMLSENFNDLEIIHLRKDIQDGDSCGIPYYIPAGSIIVSNYKKEPKTGFLNELFNKTRETYSPLIKVESLGEYGRIEITVLVNDKRVMAIAKDIYEKLDTNSDCKRLRFSF